ncbi:thioesterase [Halorientalis sp. IM1011]|uniref:PaaI family thioesterase n=1 Tax=Halorientalis sp. IM1011 TaxID=1932360 RepID=UPI00097CD3FD|nr:PaaI family thioesterase [Halorientalis sp. IM1011]AQL43179.1 thioesterase [Halorientalis sp. IM1011]
MDVTEIFSYMPFTNLVGIELTEAEDGYAEGRVEMREELASVPGGDVAHGGVTYSLADTVGGAAVISLAQDVAPTIDMRMDYLAPATDDLYAEAEVLRMGGSVAVTDIDVWDAEEHHVASARGIYKTGGDSEGTPWVRSGDDEQEGTPGDE